MKKAIKIGYYTLTTIAAIVIFGISIFSTICYILEKETVGWLTMICADIVMANAIYSNTKTLNILCTSNKESGSN